MHGTTGLSVEDVNEGELRRRELQLCTLLWTRRNVVGTPNTQCTMAIASGTRHDTAKVKNCCVGNGNLYEQHWVLQQLVVALECNLQNRLLCNLLLGVLACWLEPEQNILENERPFAAALRPR